MSGAETSKVAEGSLTNTPFVHLALYLLQNRATGTLVLTGAGQDAREIARVAFRHGRVHAARFAEAAAGSLEAGLLPLCALAAGSFAFYEGDLLADDPAKITGVVDPVAFAAQAAREHVRSETVDSVLVLYGDTPVRLAPSADLTRLSLSRAESNVIELLRAEPARVADLCALSEMDRAATRRLLYVLVVTKMVAPYETASASAPAPSSSARVQSPMMSMPPQARDKPGSAGPGNAPAGPPPGRSSSSSSAWQALAARLGTSPVAPGPSKVEGSIPPRRSVSPRPSMVPGEALDPEQTFRRIEQLVISGRAAEALPLARTLARDHASHARHHGLLAYALLLSSTDGQPSKEIVHAVNQALRIDEDEPYALYTKAMCYKRMGKEREALHYFKRTVSVMPGHIEAAREIRLYSMRGDKKGPR